MLRKIKPNSIETKIIENIEGKYDLICYNVAGVSGSKSWEDETASKLVKNAISTK